MNKQNQIQGRGGDREKHTYQVSSVKYSEATRIQKATQGRWTCRLSLSPCAQPAGLTTSTWWIPVPMALTLPFSPNSDHCLISPNFSNCRGAGLPEASTIHEVCPGVSSPCPFFLSLLLKAPLLSLPPPLRSLVGLEAHSEATPCPVQKEWPSGSQWHSSASWHTWPYTCPGDQCS